ncbi:response regulator transcription factor [Ktedonobacter racemifer]|nr:response regulator transcription factor [Ktedonobacter racemifer]
MATILLVEDEKSILQFVRDALEDADYTVLSAEDGLNALKLAREKQIDLVLLDIGLPGLDGFSVCRVLREDLHIPILIVSARQSDADKVQGFGVGADDYIMKPFSIRELLARVQAHLRREQRYRQPKRRMALLKSGGLSIDMERHEVSSGTTSLALSRKEFEVLCLLARHAGQVFARDVIFDRVWQDDTESYLETVTEHIKRIRSKLARVDAHTEYIKTIWGVGYKWEPSVTQISRSSSSSTY